LIEKTGLALPSRIEVYNEGRRILQETYYKFTPGIFTDEDGSFRMTLSPGKYKIKVSHSIDYLSRVNTFEITSTNGVDAAIALEPWVPLREKRMDQRRKAMHIYTQRKKPDNEMLRNRKKNLHVLKALISFAPFRAGQEADDASWKKRVCRHLRQAFPDVLWSGKMPKYRTGHTFLGWDWKVPKTFSGNTMDTVYENLYYQSLTARHWDFASVGPAEFFRTSNWYPRLALAQHAAAIVAHPTRLVDSG